MSKCKQLGLETLGSWPVLAKKLPGCWLHTFWVAMFCLDRCVLNNLFNAVMCHITLLRSITMSCGTDNILWNILHTHSKRWNFHIILSVSHDIVMYLNNVMQEDNFFSYIKWRIKKMFSFSHCRMFIMFPHFKDEYFVNSTKYLYIHVRVTSHTKPRAVTMRALDSRPKAVPLTWVVGVCVRPTSWRWT